MTESDSKQIDIKDAAVTHHFEHSEDSQGVVLETRYAGKELVVWYMQGSKANGSKGLGRWLTVKTFWKAMLFCMVLNWAALNDGVSIHSRHHQTDSDNDTVPAASSRQRHPDASVH
jgi:hypothetical protein